MLKFFGSYNSRFFAIKLTNEVRLYHGIAAGGLTQSNEAIMRWTRPMEDSVTGEMISLGNQGDLFFRSARGVYRLRQDPKAQREPVKKICAVARGEVPGKLGKVVVDRDGREMFYEHITPDEGIKGKLLKMFHKGQPGSGTQVHSLHQHTPPNPQTEHFKFLVDGELEEHFHWAASPKFRFLVAAVPDKKTYGVQVIDVADQSYEEFSMGRARLGGIWTNEQGAVLVDVREPGSQSLIISHKVNNKHTPVHFTPPAGYHVIAFTHSLVAVGLGKPPRLLLYGFNGALVADVDVSPLIELGIQFGFNFNERGDIDIMTWHDGHLYLHHSDSKSILTDAKRWANVARQSQQDAEEAAIREATAFHVEEKKRMERVEMSRQLAAAVGPDLITPTAPPVDRRQLPRIERVVEEPAPVNSTVPAPAPPPPVAAPPKEPVAPAPPAPEPLPFLRGGPILPPPMTEEEDDPLGLSVPASAPPPAPQAEPPAAEVAPRASHPLFGPGAAAAEPSRPAAAPPPPPAAPPAPTPVPVEGLNVEEELEKLRMHYIAGELSREEYYRRRAPLEAARRVPKEMPENPVGTPKRLELDLEKGGSGLPEPPSKQRQSGRRIDIGEVLRIEGADDESE